MSNKYNKLKVGQIYKNYRELCNYLEEDVKAGNSKISQIAEWDRYFKYKKEGNKFIIQEVLDSPAEKIVARGGANNTIFSDLIQLLIVDLLAQSDGHLQIGQSKLTKLLGMVNVNYNHCRNIMNKVSKFIDTDVRVVQEFYNMNNVNFKANINNALSKLVDKRLIHLNIITKVKELNAHNYRVATNDEIQTILLVESKTLRKMGYETVSEIRKDGKWIQFKNTTLDLIHSLTDIDYYFSAYDIVINKEYIEQERIELLNLILEKSQREESISELNKLIINNIFKNVTRRHEKAVSKESDTHLDIRSDENYINSMGELSNILINHKAPYIVDLIGKEKIDEEDIKITTEPTDIGLSADYIAYIDEQLDIF